MADVLDVDKARDALKAVEQLPVEPFREGTVVMNLADWQFALRLVTAALGGEKCDRCRERFPEPKLNTGYCDGCCDELCVCGHQLGNHAVGADGLEGCGTENCDCEEFEDPLEPTRRALAERERSR